MIELRLSALKDSKPYEYLLRFFFGGACTVVAGLVAKKYGPAVGGLFLAFPAIFPAGATLIEAEERKKKREVGSDGTRRGRMAAGSDAAGAALGCVGLVFFGLAIWLLLPRWNSVFTIAIASVLWAVITPFLWEVRKRRFCTRRNLSRNQR